MGDIGVKVKGLRQKQGKTLKEVSEITGLSTGFLSQFERGITTISVDQLANIAKVLGVKIQYFFDDSLIEDREDPVVRSYAQDVIRVFNQSIYKSLSQAPGDKHMMPKLIEMIPNASREKVDVYAHKGEEFVYVLEGILTLRLEGHEYQLYPGDSTHYLSSVPHNWANYTNQMVKFIAVHTPNDLHEIEV